MLTYKHFLFEKQLSLFSKKELAKITLAPDEQSIKHFFLENCKEYIDFVKHNFKNKEDYYNYGLLYRGFKKSVDDVNKNIFVSQEFREPKDTSEEIHNDIDKLFYKKFRWHVRSQGVFATHNYDETWRYGEEYMFFPIGKYKFVWSPEITDLYADHLYGFEDQIRSDLEDDWKEKRDNHKSKKPFISLGEYIDDNYEKYYDKELEEIVDKYKDTDLKNAILSRNEITFDCNKYYLIEPKNDELILNLIFEK